jgi:hypothetical protein
MKHALRDFRHSFQFTFGDILLCCSFYHSLTSGWRGLDSCAGEPRRSGKIVQSTYSAERFFWGVALGALVGWLVSAGVDYWGLVSSFDRRFGLRLGLEVAASACLLLPKPLLMKTVFRSRRSIFVRDEDVRAMLMGRVIGVIGGIWFGATANGMLF